MPSDEDPPDEKVMAAVRQALLLFHRGGGFFTAAEWGELPGWAMALSASAKDELERWRAALVGLASSGREGYASVVAPVDGGLERERLENDAAGEVLVSQAMSTWPEARAHA